MKALSGETEHPDGVGDDDARRWRAICAAFDESVVLDEAARDRYLEALAVRDEAQHRAVVKLLAYDRDADRLVGTLDNLTSPPLTADVLLLVGRQVAHYQITAPIASGGMGVVYRAEHLLLRRTVALKLPLTSLVGDATARGRFLREARTAARLTHANICEVLEVGESQDGFLYIAMPLYEGETLRQRLDRAPGLAVAEVLTIGRQIAQALGVAHAAGVIHRDLKPGNVMLETNGGLRILDFGLARTLDASQSQLTGTMGTVSYMAPECISGAVADARADLWSLGVMLHEMLAGQRPFAGDHPLAVAHAIVHDEPAALDRASRDVPWRLDTLVARCLRKATTERPASAAEVDGELAAVEAGTSASWSFRLRETLARRTGGHRMARALVLGVGVIACAMLALWPSRTETERSAMSARAGGTANAEAMVFFQRGEVYDSREMTVLNVTSAIDQYSKALARDSNFALAHARLAVAQFKFASRAAPDSASVAPARAHAARALQIVPTLAEGHLALGYIYSALGEYDNAIREFTMAAAGMPSDIEPISQLAMVYRLQGNWGEAKRYYRKALALDSSNVSTLLQLATTLQRNREYGDAVAIWDRLIDLEPDNFSHRLVRGYLFTRWRGITDTLQATIAGFPADWNPGGAVTNARMLLALYGHRPAEALTILQRAGLPLIEDGFLFWPRELLQGRFYDRLGDRERSRASYAAVIPLLQDALKARPFSHRVQTSLGEAYAGTGQSARARVVARALVNSAAQTPQYTAASIALLGAAEIYTRLGARTEAIALLDQLLDRSAGREASVPILRLDPTWDPLRADPRFEQMLQRPRRPSP